jgi:GntR family transcriptional regulator/MocR family aminotransferase
VYGLSKYYLDNSYINQPPTLLIGYATMNEEEIKKAVEILYDAWF